LLKLPTELHPRIASGQIPPAAIKPLVALQRIHAGLAECAVARIDAPPAQSWEEPLTWTDLVSDPIGVLVANVEGPGTELPDGVYDFADAIPLQRFALTDAAREQLDELSAARDQPVDEFVMRFGREALERASALKATHPTKTGWAHILVGQDIADELACDHIAACLANWRAAAERTLNPASSEDADDSRDASSEEDLKEQRRRERAEQERERQRAVTHNAELGSALLKHLARLKVDADVLKILTAVDVAGDLDGVAARGARYAFPGWPTETTQKNGKIKIEYLDKGQAGAKAREFLTGAGSMAEIAGRLICLIAAARYADEHAVARSNRSFSSLSIPPGLPYSDAVPDLIDEICAQRLPEHLTATVREQRAEQREALAEHQREQQAARERLASALDHAAELTERELEQALVDVDTVHGRYSVDGHRLRKQLDAIHPTFDDHVGELDARGGHDEPVAQAA